MKFAYLILTLVFLPLVSCGDKRDQPDPETIMRKAMKAHGTSVMEDAVMKFNFRGVDYRIARNNGSFEYSRDVFTEKDSFTDVLSNSGFKRFSKDSLVTLNDTLVNRYSSSLNSVVYFAQLPYSLDGGAVQMEYLDEALVNERAYHKIKVTFDEQGGGEDHEDVFVYWINAQDYLIDYLAYSYCEDDCGLRFRESVNRRNITGVTVQDYVNYKSQTFDPQLSDLDQMFMDGDLIKVSDIELREVEVEH